MAPARGARILRSSWAPFCPLSVVPGPCFFATVFNLHFPLKVAQVEAWKAGELPLIDLSRAGGQALLANPNAVTLYPDNLLYAVAPVLWAFNAHFWLHLLLAPFTMFWLARRLGLSAGPGYGWPVFPMPAPAISCLI